jgi:hypothetical protein
MKKINATVIVPVQVTVGFEVYLENLRYVMDALAQQRGVSAEFILVDYQSDAKFVPDLKGLCRNYGFRYVRKEVADDEVREEFGKIWSRGRALNVGISKARSPWVLFVDADCVVPRDYVAAHVRVCTNSSYTYALVHDSKKGIESCGDYAKLGVLAGPLTNLRRAGFSHMCVSSKWLKENGGFDERYVGWGAEDDELWLRIQGSGIKKVALDGVTPIHLWHPQWEKAISEKAGMPSFGANLVKRNRAIYRYSHAAKYGMLSIDSPGSVNLGNRLIEWALLQILGLGKPAVKASMFAPLSNAGIEQLNACDFILVPGSTVLADAAGNSEAMRSIGRLKPPVFCTAASGWGPKHPPLTSALKHIEEPVGCRDPYTLALCNRQGRKAMFVGCPTALVQTRFPQRLKVPFSIVGFARQEMRRQVAAMTGIPGKVVVALQEEPHELTFALQVTSHAFRYNDPDVVYQRYAQSEAVYTGRLHGALPAMSQRRPVCFFGDGADTRFTLLKHLGLQIYQVGQPLRPAMLTSPDAYRKGLAELREAMTEWKSATIDSMF